jgi:leucyl aminopeptidase
VNLVVLISAVENAISANAFRPGDVLTARNGLTRSFWGYSSV